jgi:hypothetical protein
MTGTPCATAVPSQVAGWRRKPRWCGAMATLPTFADMVPSIRDALARMAELCFAAAWMPVAFGVGAAGVLLGIDSLARGERPRSAALAVFAASGALLGWVACQARQALGG